MFFSTFAFVALGMSQSGQKEIIFTALFDSDKQRLLLRPTQNNKKMLEGTQMEFMGTTTVITGFKWKLSKPNDDYEEPVATWKFNVSFKNQRNDIAKTYFSDAEEYSYKLSFDLAYTKIPSELKSIASEAFNAFLECLDALSKTQSEEACKAMLKTALESLTLDTSHGGEVSTVTPGAPTSRIELKEGPYTWKDQDHSACSYIGCCDASRDLLNSDDTACHPCALCRMKQISTDPPVIEFDITPGFPFACLPCNKVLYKLLCFV
jgi:hypothetical protein